MSAVVAEERASLRAYPTYRRLQDGFVEEVPEHWSVGRLRTLVDMLVSNIDKNTVDGELPVRLCNYVDVYKQDKIREALPFMRATATKAEVDRFRLRVGDVLITKDSEAWNDIGVPALVEYEAPDLVSGYHLAILRPRASKMLGGYLLRALQSKPVAVQFHVAANGVTRYALSHGSIKATVLPIPPFADQAAIVRFLDHADRRIRRYIAAKKKLIALLNEQKQALVERVVARGVEAGVRLKYSGVEWLGDVPEHWHVRRNGSLFIERKEQGRADSRLLSISLHTGVTVLDEANRGPRHRRAASDGTLYRAAMAGDIAYNTMRMWQGAVDVVRVDGVVSPSYVVAKPLPGTFGEFFGLLLRTARYVAYTKAASKGITPHRNRLYWEDFKQLMSPVPPLDEQMRIVEVVKRDVAPHERTIQLLTKEVDLLKEYAVRLIADAVVGRFDVRTAAADAYDEDEQAPPRESGAVDDDETDLDEADAPDEDAE